MSKVVLYGMDISPPVRACLLTLDALEIPYEYKIINLFSGEHMTEEFLKHNPQHTVPVLDDNGTRIWDSHAICAYLVGKYGKTDEMYPKDLHQRAIVDQRLHFDSSILFPALRNISMPFFRKQVTLVPKEKIDNIIEGFGLFETFLDGKTYLCGDKLTIADFCCVASITSLSGFVPIDAQKYPQTMAWLDRIAALPYYEKDNAKGAKEYIGMLRPNLTLAQV